MSDIKEGYGKRLESKLRAGNEADPKAISDEEELKPLVNWLARLRLFYGVPFHYLVPLEEMLPDESIKFFYVDPNWTAALMDGAFSIGRLTAGDDADKKESRAIEIESDAETQKIRPGMIKNHPEPEITLQPKITGFLLRSNIVAHYPGLEIDGYENPSGGKKLQILRLDRSAPNILLCLFKGILKRLELHEPPEGIFFGFNPPQNGKIKKEFRDPKTLDTDSARSLEIPFKDKEKRVINILEVAKTLGGFWGKPLTSADVAMQMVQGVEKVVFTIKC
jgi:hypothetical protein